MEIGETRPGHSAKGLYKNRHLSCLLTNERHTAQLLRS